MLQTSIAFPFWLHYTDTVRTYLSFEILHLWFVISCIMVYAIDINPTTFPAARYATIGSLLSTILPLFIIVMALAFLAFLMKGAFLWVIAEGDKKKHEDARKTIEYSIWGMFLVTISFVLVKVITAIFHIDQLFR